MKLAFIGGCSAFFNIQEQIDAQPREHIHQKVNRGGNNPPADSQRQ
ncbi:hypothetical protein [Scandinavium goeteborgense]|nr:hypothetical protein [Scandinavium goeteborgense]QKN80778.1 hypothetical protein A8O29_005560 [Scandinavium goeteborgense]